MKIVLAPTHSFETFKGVQFRLFKGTTSAGTEVQMLGLWRVLDADKRGAFLAELANAVQHERPEVTALIAPGASLITGAEGVAMKRRETVAKALERAHAEGAGVQGYQATDYSWAEFAPAADALLAQLERMR